MLHTNSIGTEVKLKWIELITIYHQYDLKSYVVKFQCSCTYPRKDGRLSWPCQTSPPALRLKCQTCQQHAWHLCLYRPPQMAGGNPLVGPNSFKTLGEGPTLVLPKREFPPTHCTDPGVMEG